MDDIYSRVAYSNDNRTGKWDTSHMSAPHASDFSNCDDGEQALYEAIETIQDITTDMSGAELMRYCLNLDDVRGLPTGEKIDLVHVSKYL